MTSPEEPAAGGRDSGRAPRPAPSTGTPATQAALGPGGVTGTGTSLGGWLRPTVVGAVDGLVTNASLIAGVGGSGVSSHTIVLTGLAGTVAGAFSRAPGSTCR